MKAKRILKTISLLLVTGVGFALLYFEVSFRINPNSRLEAEQQIYSVLIDEESVFEEHTSLGEIDLSEQIFQYLKEQAPRVEDDTLRDFQRQNNQVSALRDYFPERNDYTFLNNSQMEQFYSDWPSFSNRYPKVDLIISFSRIGFNSRFTQAIVLESRNAKIFDAPFEYAGNGVIYIFKRIGNKWIVQYQIVVSVTG